MRPTLARWPRRRRGRRRGRRHGAGRRRGRCWWAPDLSGRGATRGRSRSGTARGRGRAPGEAVRRGAGRGMPPWRGRRAGVGGVWRRRRGGGDPVRGVRGRRWRRSTGPWRSSGRGSGRGSSTTSARRPPAAESLRGLGEVTLGGPDVLEVVVTELADEGVAGAGAAEAVVDLAEQQTLGVHLVTGLLALLVGDVA